MDTSEFYDAAQHHKMWKYYNKLIYWFSNKQNVSLAIIFTDSWFTLSVLIVIEYAYNSLYNIFVINKEIFAFAFACIYLLFIHLGCN